MSVWVSAWLHGAVAADDVLDAVKTWSEVNEVVAADEGTATELEIPATGEPPVGPALLLAGLRRCGAGAARLLLPAPGDARGLGGPGPFLRAAMEAGETVVFPDVALGLVPEVLVEGITRWTVHAVPPCPSQEHLNLADAEHTLATVMREATRTLSSLDVAKYRPGVRAEIEAAINNAPKPPWPARTPPRTIRVFQRAAEVEAILMVAAGDSPGGALSASAARARGDALRPLTDAVRAARRAAVDEAVRVLADQAGQH